MTSPPNPHRGYPSFPNVIGPGDAVMHPSEFAKRGPQRPLTPSEIAEQRERSRRLSTFVWLALFPPVGVPRLRSAIGKLRRARALAWATAAAMVTMAGGAAVPGLPRPLGPTPVAQAAPVGGPTVPAPGMEWFKALGCMPDLCVGVGADTRGPLNGDPETLVPIDPMTGPLAPVRVEGFTDINGIACEPASSTVPGCIVVGERGALGGSYRAEYTWVGRSAVTGVTADVTFPITSFQDLGTATCISQGVCVAAGNSGVAVVHAGVPGRQSLTPRSNLGALSIACARSSECLITTSSGIVTFDPATGALGTARPWAGIRGGGTIACPTAQACYAVTSTGRNESVLARVDPATGAASHGTALAVNTDVGALTCPTATRCLVVGSRLSGSYPHEVSVPVVVPVLDGAPRPALAVATAGASTGLAAAACAESSTPALGPRDVTPAPCVAVGAASAYSGPGVQTAGAVLPLTARGRVRYFSYRAPSLALKRFAIGELVATDPRTGKFFPCTATVVTSPRGDLVVTAAHCVQSLSDNHKYVSLVFAPGHTGSTCHDLNCGRNPVGTWTAQPAGLTVYPDAAHHPRFDWAFVRVHPSPADLPVERVVGGLKLDFSPDRRQPWTIFGYPHGAQISHGVYPLNLVLCSGSSMSAPSSAAPGPGPLGLFIAPPNCNHETEGASGGPWVDGDGAVGAVNKAQTAGLGIVGTYLGADAAKAYTVAAH